jgi:hypothetical protein
MMMMMMKKMKLKLKITGPSEGRGSRAAPARMRLQLRSCVAGPPPPAQQRTAMWMGTWAPDVRGACPAPPRLEAPPPLRIACELADEAARALRIRQLSRARPPGAAPTTEPLPSPPLPPPLHVIIFTPLPHSPGFPPGER